MRNEDLLPVEELKRIEEAEKAGADKAKKPVSKPLSEAVDKSKIKISIPDVDSEIKAQLGVDMASAGNALLNATKLEIVKQPIYENGKIVEVKLVTFEIPDQAVRQKQYFETLKLYLAEKKAKAKSKSPETGKRKDIAIPPQQLAILKQKLENSEDEKFKKQFEELNRADSRSDSIN